MLWRMPADLGRQRIGMMFIGIDASTGTARSAATAATTRTDRRRLVHGRQRQMSGGKGAKGGNLESLGNRGPADDVATRRKPAETGGNRRARPWRGTSGVAEIAENKFYVADRVLVSPSRGDAQADGGCHRLPSGGQQGRSIEALDRKPEESGDCRRDIDQACRALRRARRAAAVVGHQERPCLVR